MYAGALCHEFKGMRYKYPTIDYKYFCVGKDVKTHTIISDSSGPVSSVSNEVKVGV